MTLKPAMNSSNRCFLMASCSRRLLSRWDVTWSNSDTRAKYASSCTRTTWKLSTTHSEKPTTYQNKRTTPATLNNTTRTVPRHQKKLNNKHYVWTWHHHLLKTQNTQSCLGTKLLYIWSHEEFAQNILKRRCWTFVIMIMIWSWYEVHTVIPDPLSHSTWESRNI